jgi:uncharacterized membrane protein YkvA (DUF1232 family)
MAFENWRRRADVWKREAGVLYHASRDPRVPWYAKALGVTVIAYALSPIDLIPDFIPVLGWLDDLLLVPLGILAVRADPGQGPRRVPRAGWSPQRAATLKCRRVSW